MKRKAKLHPTYVIVRRIIDAGNGPGLFREWYRAMLDWADHNPGADADAIKAWLHIVKPRPFYTAEELSRFWPALKLALGLESRMTEPPSPNRLANELDFYRLPFVTDEEGRKFFIVEQVAKWKGAKLTQKEIENAILDR